VGEGGTVSDKTREKLEFGVWQPKHIREMLDENKEQTGVIAEQALIIEGMRQRIAELEKRVEYHVAGRIEAEARIHQLEAENARLRELVEVAEEAVELERSIFSLPDNGTTVVLRDGWTGKPIVGKVVDFSSFAR
jgi:chromosome segregation ATPase